MDENRLFTAGTTPGQTGYGHGSEYAMNMGAMVARDRNHPSALQKRTQSDLIQHCHQRLLYAFQLATAG
jgi:hypothetical protein